MTELPSIGSAGDAIRRLRNDSGLSLSSLARLLGWDKGRLSKYENNELRLSLPVIERIAHALNKPPELVVLECIKIRYPALARSDSKPGQLLQELVDQIAQGA